MKKTKATVIGLAAIAFAGCALAKGSIRHSSQALTHSAQSVKHSVQAVGNGSMAGAKLISGAVAVPLKIFGAVSIVSGQMSDQMSEDLWNTASGKPFELTDQSFIKAGLPPHEAIQD